jgi:predicted PurR-regulated permease PerM
VGGIAGTSLMTIFFLFFSFRDGERLWRNVTSLSPLSPEQTAHLAATVRDTMAANVYGVLAVGVAQGAATGLLLAAAGLPSPILWGCVAAIASILPPFGASVVWFPAGAALIIMGSTGKGAAVLAVGALGVASLDNIIRPLVLQGRVQMGTLAILVSLLGGLQAFGLLGLFAGPVIFALTAELGKMLWAEYAKTVRDH